MQVLLMLQMSHMNCGCKYSNITEVTIHVRIISLELLYES
jgi:hypothetical protein